MADDQEQGPWTNYQSQEQGPWTKYGAPPPNPEAEAATHPPVAPVPTIPQTPAERLAPLGNQKPIQMAGTPPAQDAYEDIKGGQVAKGVHKVATSLADAYKPLAIPAAIAAPLPFAASVAGGTLGNLALKHGSEYLGLSPDQSDVAGDVGALAGGMGAGAATSKFLPGGIRSLAAKALRDPETGKVTITPSSILERVIPKRATPPPDYNYAPFPQAPDEVDLAVSQGRAAKLPVRVPKTVEPKPADELSLAIREGRAARLPTRIPRSDVIVPRTIARPGELPESDPQDLITRTRALVKPGEQPSPADLKRAGDLTQAPLQRLKDLAKFGDELAKNEINRRLRNQ